MKKTVFLLVAIIFSLNIIAQNPNPSSTIDAEVANIMNTQHLPGVSTLIVKGGEIVWIESYGYANTDLATPFTDTTSLMIASISKVFTGIALMQLYENGSIGLDDDINDYLPFDINIPDYESYPITFRMLLTHTSSIKDGDAMDNYYNLNGDPTISLADCIERYFMLTGSDYSSTDNFLNNQPGTIFEYSNMATALDGYLVELISGMSFSQYCNDNIFNPLCMDNTHWYLSEYQNMNMLANPHDYYSSQYEPIDHYGFADYPDGMLHANVTDLANFMITILQDGIFHSNTLLSASTLNDMFTLQVPTIDPTQGLQFYKETFNVSSGSISLWGHSGGEYGVSTEMYFDQNNDMGIAVLANGENEATQILKLLYDYGLTLSPSGIGNPDCNSTNVIDTPKYLFLYNVYPNPAKDIVTFKADNLNIVQHDIVISDITGNQLMLFEKNDSEITIDVSNLSDGFYFYAIKESNNVIETGKLIINK
ncbi:MAG: serine hydrolase [Bacteroidales bacterium]|nr:serine hydrolase [Bacteroidales bacterium]